MKICLKPACHTKIQNSNVSLFLKGSEYLAMVILTSSCPLPQGIALWIITAPAHTQPTSLTYITCLSPVGIFGFHPGISGLSSCSFSVTSYLHAWLSHFTELGYTFLICKQRRGILEVFKGLSCPSIL